MWHQRSVCVHLFQSTFGELGSIIYAGEEEFCGSRWMIREVNSVHAKTATVNRGTFISCVSGLILIHFHLCCTKLMSKVLWATGHLCMPCLTAGRYLCWHWKEASHKSDGLSRKYVQRCFQNFNVRYKRRTHPLLHIWIIYMCLYWCWFVYLCVSHRSKGTLSLLLLLW